MQEPISDERASYHGALSYPQTCSAHTNPPWGQPYEGTIGADLFQLGSLGLWAERKPLKQNPNSQNPPELDHLLPDTTITPIRLINPHAISSYRLTTLQATRNPLSPNLHNPRFSLNLSTPQPHPFAPLSRPIILLSHTTTQTTAKSESETMQTPSHHHKFTKL